MEFVKVAASAWRPYFVVMLSTVQKSASAQCKVAQPSTALCFSNGLDSMATFRGRVFSSCSNER